MLVNLTPFWRKWEWISLMNHLKDWYRVGMVIMSTLDTTPQSVGQWVSDLTFLKFETPKTAEHTLK